MQTIGDLFGRYAASNSLELNLSEWIAFQFAEQGETDVRAAADSFFVALGVASGSLAAQQAMRDAGITPQTEVDRASEERSLGKMRTPSDGEGGRTSELDVRLAVTGDPHGPEAAAGEQDEQLVPLQLEQLGGLSKAQFQAALLSPRNRAVCPRRTAVTDAELSHPLAHYWTSCSHNS